MRNLSHFAIFLLFTLAAGLGPFAAGASTVKILRSTLAGTIANADADDDLNAFYNGVGATSSLHTGTLIAPDLVGVDLLVLMLPDDAFSPSEIVVIDDFVAAGGELLLVGDQVGFSATENGYLNDLLTGIGGSMSLNATALDSGFNDTVPSQIIAQPGLTDSVFDVNYGNVNSISGVDPGREIFLATDLTSVWGGYELIVQTRVVLLADANMISNLEDTVGNDNHVFFSNLVDIQTQNTSVKILSSALAGTIAGGDADNDLNAFYQANGISSSLWPGEVSDEALLGVELLVVMLPDDAFTVSELTAMDDFLIAGGRVLFMGEQESFSAPENAYIDTALAALGSSLALGASELDTSGLQDSIVGQILLHPYNVGVSVLNYGNVNTVTGVPAGGGLDGQLFLAKDLASVWGAVDDLPTGGIVILVADVNLLSNIEDEAGNDNHVFFLNIAPDPAVEVPMLGPAAIVLAGLLLAGSGMRLSRGAR